MRQIIYLSTAADGFGQVDMVDVLEASARNNPASGISGFLLFNGRNFLQLIEGEKPALRSLLAKLAHDPRHSGITLLEDQEIDMPTCSKWSMRRIKLADNVAQRTQDLKESLPEGLGLQTQRIVLNFAVLN